MTDDERSKTIAQLQARAWVRGLAMQAKAGGLVLPPEELGRAAGYLLAYAADAWRIAKGAGKRSDYAAMSVAAVRPACLEFLKEMQAEERANAARGEVIADNILNKLGVKCPE